LAIVYYVNDPVPHGAREIEKIKLLENNDIRIISTHDELRGLFNP